MKKGVKVLVFCIFLMFITSNVFADEVTDDLLDIAKNYYSEGNNSKTLEYVNQILSIDENNVEALGLKVRLNPPKVNKTYPDLKKPLLFDIPYAKTSNQAVDMSYEQALNFYNAKDFAKSEECLNQALKEGGDASFRIYNTLGLALWAQRKVDEAKAAFLKSNEINGLFTLPLDNLSQVYKQTDKLTDCKQTLEKAISNNPKDFCAYLLLGDYYRFVDNSADALVNYRKVVALNPKYSNAYLKIAVTRTDTMDFLGSIETLNYYLKMNPSDDYAYFLIAKNYQYANDFEKAKEAMYKAIMRVNAYEYRAELGKIFYYSGNVQDALELFLQSVNKNSTAETYNYIGMCYYQLHQFNKAITYLNKALTMSDYRIIYHYNLAKVYESLKDDISYERCMNSIRDYALDSYQDYIDKSSILFDSQSKNSAIAVLNDGIVRYPHVKELYLEKLKIYDLTDDKEGTDATKKEMEKVFK